MKRIETGKWCISSDGEHFHEDCDTKEDAIVVAKEDYQYGTFYIGKAVGLEFTPSDVSVSDNVYESLIDSLTEEVGEFAETWDCTQEQLDDLDKMLGNTVVEWINKHGLQPTCYGVTGVCKIEAE